MPEVKNIKISKVFEGKSGKREKKAWTVYNLYFVGSENKYGYFGGKGKIVPTEGMQIASMEYEITEKDGYTNHIITKMVVAEGSQHLPNPPQNPQNDTKGTSQKQSNGKAYLDHGKVVLALMDMAGGAAVDRGVFLTLIDEFKIGLAALLGEKAKGTAPRNDNTSDSEPEWENPPPAGDEPPF